MAEKRDYQRIDCAEKCFLYHEGSKYCGVIMNISISGALVSLGESTHAIIMPGDTCSMMLGDEPAKSFCRYKSQVIRVNPSGVGLKILGINI